MNERPSRNISGRPLFIEGENLAFGGQDNRGRFCLLFVVAFLLIGSVIGLSEPISFSPVQVALVSDHRTIEPGKPFLVAIHQDIQPGYHTYWKNAGTVGLASSIKWILPDGFTAGPLQWPIPEISQMADYRVWAYRDEALLVTEITPPADLPLNHEYTLSGEASWMCCGKQCYPGFDTMSVTVTSGKTARQALDWQPRFRRVLNEQPRPAESWSLKAERRGEHYQLTVTPLDPSQVSNIRNVFFFGYERQVSSDKAQKVTLTPTSLVITMEHEEFSGEDRDRLTGMLASSTPWQAAFPQSPLLVDVPLVIKDDSNE